jgi:NhaP-type Na+/H+ or K+/H+ antiporter
MADLAILVISGALLLVVAVSGRLSRVWLTEPLAMVVLGLVAAAVGLGPVALDHPASLIFLELTLALVLFTDAARIDLTKRKGRRLSWPARMLGIGLPLAIILGAVAAGLLFDVPLGVALLIGAILAPTDAALAEPVLEVEELPMRVRQSLNVEAGLNDGLALPGLFIALGIIEAEEGTRFRDAVLLVVAQVGIGVAGGLVAGLIGAWVIGRATSRGWMNPLHQKISALALALACFAAVQMLGGSGFVATFVAGGVLAARIRPRCEYLYEFAEEEGKVLVLLAFLFIGAGPVYLLVTNGAPIEVWALAFLSLFVIRPVAIAVSLIGAKLLPATKAFLGWFGPRGLATVVFFLVASEELGMVEMRDLNLLIATVALSILLHGLSAKPASNWLARRIARAEWAEMPEMTEVYANPTRGFSKQSPR